MAGSDAPVALGSERYLGPLLVASLNLPLWAFGLVAEASVRRLGLPSIARGLRVGAPFFALAFIWGPALWRIPQRDLAVPEHRAVGAPLVVLITLDTFRADHLNAQRDPSKKAKTGLTPALDALAASGAILTQAVTSAPLTAPAHAGMFTGKTPTEHGLVRNGQEMAEADMPSVMATIRAAGWRTGAFVSSNVLDRNVGLARGFEHYDDRWGAAGRLRWIPGLASLLGPPLHQVRRGDETIARALRWLAESTEPTVLWVHLYDPHSPYIPPAEWWPPAAELAEAKAADDEASQKQEDRRTLAGRGGAGPPPRRAYQGRAMYRAEIRWTDHLVGMLVEALGVHAVIFAVGDHGESLGEHKSFFTHGADLYEPVLKVPFIVRWPARVEPGTRIDDLTSNTQVADLLLEATGLAPYRGLHKVESAAAYTSGQHAPPGKRAMKLAQGATEAHVGACVRLSGEKVVTNDGAAYMHFDLVADPDELDPHAVPLARLAEEGEVRRMITFEVPPAANGERERLEALGYLE